MDHNPPQFHAEYQGQRAEFDIRTLELIARSLPGRAYALVLEWASLHRSELLANWNRAVEGELPSPIEPLP